jgi:hypothetical protein
MAPDPGRTQWRKGRQDQDDRVWQGRHGMSAVDRRNSGQAHPSSGTSYPPAYSEWPKSSDSKSKFRFAGYSVQQYVTRTFKTGKRPVKAYDRIMAQIPKTVKQYLDFLKRQDLPEQDLELGHIPFLYSLVPLAQTERVPIHALKESKRLIGNQFRQVEDYYKLMDSFCDRLLKNIGDAK